VATALVLVTVVAGCGRSSLPTVTPSVAAETFASVYKLPPSEQRCLERAFTHDRAATRPLASNGPAHDTDLAALGRVARSCIAVSTLADAVVGGATEGSTPLTTTQQACLRQAVGQLGDDDRATMLAGLAVPTALGDIQTAELGKITDRLLTDCHISLSDITATDTTA
jgi:hypothetical protein